MHIRLPPARPPPLWRIMQLLRASSRPCQKNCAKIKIILCGRYEPGSRSAATRTSDFVLTACRRGLCARAAPRQDRRRHDRALRSHGDRMRLLLRDRTKIALRCPEIECDSSSTHPHTSERASVPPATPLPPATPRLLNCTPSPSFSHAAERARELIARLAHLRLSELLALWRRARLERLLRLRAQRVELHEQC